MLIPLSLLERRRSGFGDLAGVANPIQGRSCSATAGDKIHGSVGANFKVGHIRRPASDKRFASVESTRAYLSQMQIAENGQPQTAASDLKIIREAGLPAAEIFWKELNEVVIGGPKPVDRQKSINIR